MKKILILSFRKLGDVLSLALPIHNYKANNPFCQITLCTYDENLPAANLLAQVDKVVTISRSRLGLLAQNKIFNKSFLVNEFTSQLSEIINETWDTVFNASNDQLGTYLASGLNTSAVQGICLSNSLALIHSSPSSFIKNEINTTFSATPVHQTDLDNYTMNNSMTYQGYSKSIRIDPTMDFVANEEIKKIREKVSRMLVGINYQASNSDKELNLETVELLINEIFEDIKFYPIIILDPSNQKSKTDLETLNKKFNNRIIAIEVDLKGLPSILTRLDYFISVDTSLKHIADACGVKMVEVSTGYSPFLRQGSITPGNIIISPIDENRPNVKPGSEKNSILGTNGTSIKTSTINGKDLYFSLLLRSGNSPDSIPFSLGPNITCYIVKNQSPGISYLPYWGDIKIEHELIRVTSTIFCFDHFFNEKLLNYWINFSHFFSTSEISDYISREKANLAVALKAILNCLRTIRNKDIGQKDHKTFMSNLSTLIDWPYPDSVVAIPMRSFESGLNTIDSKNKTSSYAEVEKLLFSLKSQLQSLTTTLDLMNIKKSAATISHTRQL